MCHLEDFKVDWSAVTRATALRAAEVECPACGSDQIQLLDMLIPARWKCRRCKKPFLAEPTRKE